MKTIRTWLIIRNGDDLRLAKRKPSQLASNEVSIEIIINAPTPPRVAASLTIDLPEAPPVIASATVIDYPDEDLEEAHRQALREAAGE